MGISFEEMLVQCREGKLLKAEDLRRLCAYVTEILVEEPNVVSLSAPIKVVGDVHGQFHDVISMFEVGGDISSGFSYVMLGDYVDRGAHSVETMALLMALKACYPDRLTLLRGNHETREITRVYGFYDECTAKYGGTFAWNAMCAVFDCLPLAAVIDNEIMCVHGGISPEIAIVDQMQAMQRHGEVPPEGAVCDLMWSDPTTLTQTWALNERGAGYMFGSRVANDFNHVNGFRLICRAHQLAQDGYSYPYGFTDQSVVTVWSAPNYCYRCQNTATIMSVDENLDRKFIYFEEASSMHFDLDEMPAKDLYFL